jgi:riboflavin kinase/FMN adenylyltransferase
MRRYSSLIEILPTDDWGPPDSYRPRDVWLTIGSFDGVHKGHQAVIHKLTTGAHAAGVPAVVLTFYPPPPVVLGRRNGPYDLTSPDERAKLLGDLGVDAVITHPFDLQLAKQSAHQFVQTLHERLRLRHLCVGHDFALGHRREGDLPMLHKLGQEFGFTLNVMRPIRLAGEVVSSSRIRAALRDGEVKIARSLLGRPYQVGGLVVPGDGRGRTLGIPTANLDVYPQRLLPKTGVYACLVDVKGSRQRAVANIGIRPTFENQSPMPRLEVHLLDYENDLYGQQISVQFIARLRDEQRFLSIQALVDQIQHDIQRARRLLRLPR